MIPIQTLLKSFKGQYEEALRFIIERILVILTKRLAGYEHLEKDNTKRVLHQFFIVKLFLRSAPTVSIQNKYTKVNTFRFTF